MSEHLSFVAWFVWAVPILGAVLTPVLALVGDRIRNYGAVAFAFLSAAFAAVLLPTALAGETMHHQVPWIAPLGITAGVLADPLSILMSNVVGWISFLIGWRHSSCLAWSSGARKLTAHTSQKSARS